MVDKIVDVGVQPIVLNLVSPIVITHSDSTTTTLEVSDVQIGPTFDYFSFFGA